jgi:hypothetical protein
VAYSSSVLLLHRSTTVPRLDVHRGSVRWRRIIGTARVLIQLVVASAAIALGGCATGPSGTPAGSVTIGGKRAVLLDADPCMWNGDSGCTDHSLGGRDGSFCLDGMHSLGLDAGADALRVSASVGECGDHQWLGGAVAKGRIELAVRRTTARRFSIALPRTLSADLRVLHVDIRYGDDVITPYTPFNERLSNGDSPQRFRRGLYAIRIRTAPVGDC